MQMLSRVIISSHTFRYCSDHVTCFGGRRYSLVMWPVLAGGVTLWSCDLFWREALLSGHVTCFGGRRYSLITWPVLAGDVTLVTWPVLAGGVTLWLLRFVWSRMILLSVVSNWETSDRGARIMIFYGRGKGGVFPWPTNMNLVSLLECVEFCELLILLLENVTNSLQSLQAQNKPQLPYRI